jgi:hypothetical protein
VGFDVSIVGGRCFGCDSSSSVKSIMAVGGRCGVMAGFGCLVIGSSSGGGRGRADGFLGLTRLLAFMITPLASVAVSVTIIIIITNLIKLSACSKSQSS